MFKVCVTITLALKSALPVAALEQALLSDAAQTAPLCPMKVPTQSPVSPCRSIGLPSLQAEIMKYLEKNHILFCLVYTCPSFVLSEKLRSTTGRVCPEHVNGVCRAITDGAEIKIYHFHFAANSWETHKQR